MMKRIFLSLLLLTNVFVVFFANAKHSGSESANRVTGLTKHDAYFAFRNVLGRRYDEMTSLSSDEYTAVSFDGDYYDNGVYADLCLHTFSPDNQIFSTVFKELLGGIYSCNQTIEELGQEHADVPLLRAARVFYTLLLMDNWGNTPIIDHVLSDSELPSLMPRGKVAQWIEQELLAVRADCPVEVSNDTYGIPTRWMVDALLAKLYINWPVYTKDVTKANWNYGDNEKINACVEVCDDVIESGAFDLNDDFKKKFMYDNGVQIKDFIYAMPYDALSAQGMTYMRSRSWRMANKGNGQYSIPLNYSVAGNFALNPEFASLFCLDNDRRNDCIIGDGTKEKTIVHQYDAYTGERTPTICTYNDEIVTFTRNIKFTDNNAMLNVGRSIDGYCQGYRSVKFFPYVLEFNAYNRN